MKRCSPKLQKKSAEYRESSLKRDAFGSLESLFDLKKPLNLPDICSLAIEYHQEGHLSPFISRNSKNSKNFVESIFLQQVDLEPHILERVWFWYYMYLNYPTVNKRNNSVVNLIYYI